MGEQGALCASFLPQTMGERELYAPHDPNTKGEQGPLYAPHDPHIP